MKIFLAGTSTRDNFDEIDNVQYALESFYYLRSNAFPQTKSRIKQRVFKDFLLDSGAFTYLNGSKKAINWKAYVNEYIDFINEYDIKHFFELDIDGIVGYDNVLEIRKYIEQQTNKRCIPVWHKSRGIEDFETTIKNYEYAAIGGLVTKEIKEKEYHHLDTLIRMAIKQGCKLHGLGFTKLKILRDYKFYSVDSTSWLSGGRFGTLYHFNGNTIIAKRFKDKRGIYKTLDRHNLKQWIKYQEYAKRNL